MGSEGTDPCTVTACPYIGEWDINLVALGERGNHFVQVLVLVIEVALEIVALLFIRIELGLHFVVGFLQFPVQFRLQFHLFLQLTNLSQKLDDSRVIVQIPTRYIHILAVSIAAFDRVARRVSIRC